MCPPDRAKRPAEPANWWLRLGQAADLAQELMPDRPAPLPDQALQGQDPLMRGPPKPPQGAAPVEPRFCPKAEDRSSLLREHPPASPLAPGSPSPMRDRPDAPRRQRQRLAEAAVHPARPPARHWLAPPQRCQTGTAARLSRAPPFSTFLRPPKGLRRAASRAAPVAQTLPSDDSPGRSGHLPLPKRPSAALATKLGSAKRMRSAQAPLPRRREPTTVRARVEPGLQGPSRHVASRLSAPSAGGGPAPNRRGAPPALPVSCRTPQARQRCPARQGVQRR